MTTYTPDPRDSSSLQSSFQPAPAWSATDLALRSFLLRVFNTMAGGLVVTGVVAYVAAARRHATLRRRAAWAGVRRIVCEQGAFRVHRNWSAIASTLAHTPTGDHAYAVDLDVTGHASLWQDEAYPYVMVFTGDLPDVGRHGLAVEPMTCPPNAFRTGEALIRLEPGSSYTSSWGITPLLRP